MKFTLAVDPCSVRYCPCCEEYVHPDILACPWCEGSTYWVLSISAEKSQVRVNWDHKETELSWKTMT